MYYNLKKKGLFMNKIKFITPDFKNCNLNISATLAKFLGAENKNATLFELETELNKNYQNIVFICFDGMGMHPLEINLSNSSILQKNIKRVLVSTFPSTTTNATTSLLTNKLPLEHGWFGWNLYFEDIRQNIDLFTHRNSQTGEKVDYNYPMGNITDYYFDNAHTDYQINTIFMPYCYVKYPERNTYIHDEFELAEAIEKITSKTGKQFIYAYFDDPDKTMHDYGVSSKQAKDKIESINNIVQKLSEICDDTLFIITADHGQVDISGYIEFYKDTELNNMLECIPFLDARTPAFKVKKGYKKVFEQKFKEKYSADFVLFKSKDLIKKGYFGNFGDKGFLLGDYIAIGTYTNKTFLSHENNHRFLGHHTSLTQEMQVPLILISSK